ncbi:MAG TPA: hypothetical protein VF638_00815 [Sphingomonas sp.]|jgi:hypothetical protein
MSWFVCMMVAVYFSLIPGDHAAEVSIWCAAATVIYAVKKRQS